MKIIDKVHPDKYGRITLSNIGIESYEGVKFFVNPGSEMIEVLNGKDYKYGQKLELDQAHRITIPKWIREEINGRDLFLLVDENDGRIFLSTKTGDIL